MKAGADLLVIDLETNAQDYPDVKITQIGAVMLEGGTLKEIGRFNRYVDGRTRKHWWSKKTLPEKSVRITGITAEMVAGKGLFSEVGPSFGIWAQAVSKKFIPTAWGTHFDIPVLRWECARAGIKFVLPGKSFCIKSAAYNFFWTRGVPIYRCSVDTCLKILGLKFEGKPHDGLDDALNEARILRVLTGVEPPGPTAQVKYGNFTKTQGSSPVDLGPDDEKSPYE